MEFGHPLLLVLLHHLTPASSSQVRRQGCPTHSLAVSPKQQRKPDATYQHALLADAFANCCSFLITVQQFMVGIRVILRHRGGC